MNWPRAISVALAMAACIGCGGGSGSTGACGPVQNEALDRRSLTHVLPGAAPVDYLTNPPTSGPHQPTPPVDPVSKQPLVPAVQVGVLESGKALIQYRDLTDTEMTELLTTSGPDVVIAPNPDLPAGEDRIVATAWLTKQSCTAPDPTALQDFIATRRDRAPEQQN